MSISRELQYLQLLCHLFCTRKYFETFSIEKKWEEHKVYAFNEIKYVLTQQHGTCIVVPYVWSYMSTHHIPGQSSSILRFVFLNCLPLFQIKNFFISYESRKTISESILYMQCFLKHLNLIMLIFPKLMKSKSKLEKQ